MRWMTAGCSRRSTGKRARWRSKDVVYPLKTKDFPTVDREDPPRLSEEEEEVMQDLQHAFMNSVRLRQHVDFLYSRGSMYLVLQ